MNNRIKAVRYYCENEIKNFKESEMFCAIKSLAQLLGYNIECVYGSEKAAASNNQYLSVAVYDQRGRLVENPDGFLTTATMLVGIDKQERIKFFSWQEEEFIDELNWIINSLKNKII